MNAHGSYLYSLWVYCSFCHYFISLIFASARSIALGHTACVKIVCWIRFKQKPARQTCALSKILISKTNKTSLRRPYPKSSAVVQISAYNHVSFEMCPSLSKWSCEVHTRLSQEKLVWQYWFGVGLTEQSCGSCCSASWRCNGLGSVCFWKSIFNKVPVQYFNQASRNYNSELGV